MLKTIIEGKIKIKVPKEAKVSKKLPIFYNPVMELNRSISIALLNAIKNKDMQIGLPLAGTGVRGVRFLKELKKGKIKSISFNDINPKFKSILKANLKLNSIAEKTSTKQDEKSKIIISNQEANLFLHNTCGFDYIDIDPFGEPNPFLDASIRRLSRGGILAVTATDTSALSGTFPKACKRKYWATPKRDDQMHETGLRILIRKVQLVAAQYDKALTPIYSYSKDHYMRAFLVCEKGKQRVDELLKLHDTAKNGAGPLWTGQLWDKEIAEKIHTLFPIKFTEIIAKESYIQTNGKIGFFDIHSLSKELKIGSLPKQEDLIQQIKKQKDSKTKKCYNASPTHFSGSGLRSDIPKEKLVKILKKN